MRLALIVISCLVILSAGCMPESSQAFSLPTAVPGIVVDNGSAEPLQNDGRKTSTGVTSTPAPWATAMPPTPAPNRAHPISHDLKGKADCVSCHRGPTYYRMPADHATRTNQTCLGCHSPNSGPPHPAPHPLAGRANCLLCHLRGTNGARAVPGDHGGKLNDTCATCHAIQ